MLSPSSSTCALSCSLPSCPLCDAAVRPCAHDRTHHASFGTHFFVSAVTPVRYAPLLRRPSRGASPTQPLPLLPVLLLRAAHDPSPPLVPAPQTPMSSPVVPPLVLTTPSPPQATVPQAMLPSPVTFPPVPSPSPPPQANTPQAGLPSPALDLLGLPPSPRHLQRGWYCATAGGGGIRNATRQATNSLSKL